MLFARQWNIIVELLQDGRTAHYIADRFDCSIFTMRQIRKSYRERVYGKDCQVVVVQRRPQPVMSAISEGL